MVLSHHRERITGQVINITILMSNIEKNIFFPIDLMLFLFNFGECNIDFFEGLLILDYD